MSNPVELYRIKLGIKSGGASWGDWKYYESVDSFKRALFEYVIESKAGSTSRGWADWYPIRLWNERVLHKTLDGPVATNIFAVESMVNGEWVPVQYEFLPPRLELKNG